ncbi:MAG: hypothetical protein N3A72_11605 [bacterium]|nr:hypothetical protein [bacterium]
MRIRNSFIIFSIVGLLHTIAFAGYSTYSLSIFLPKTTTEWIAIGTTQHFDRQTIFDYMDGTGELYRSYSFRELVVQRYKPIQSNESEITVELFDMGSSADAFGIFSFEQMDEPVGIGQGSEYGGGLLRFWKNRFFINIYMENETELAKQTILALGREIATAISENGTIPNLVAYLPQAGLIDRSIRYFHLQSGLNYHYQLAEKNIFNLDSTTNALLAKYQFGSEKPYLLIIQYPSQTAANRALNDVMSYYKTYGEMKMGKNSSIFFQIQKKRWIAITKAKEDLLFIILNANSKLIAEKLLNATTKF